MPQPFFVRRIPKALSASPAAARRAEVLSQCKGRGTSLYFALLASSVKKLLEVMYTVDPRGSQDRAFASGRQDANGLQRAVEQGGPLDVLDSRSSGTVHEPLFHS